MKNIHFINVFFFGQTRALDVFFFFFFFFWGGGGGDCIKRKKKHTKAQGTLVLGKRLQQNKESHHQLKETKHRCIPQKIQTNTCRLQRRKETNYRGIE